MRYSDVDLWHVTHSAYWAEHRLRGFLNYEVWMWGGVDI
jgi:hypothetical protein